MTGNAIQTHGLTKVYTPSRNPFNLKQYTQPSSKVTALQSVDLSVPEGATCALLGKNGAGKTTLVKLLSTLVLPTSGSAKIHGLDVVKNAEMVKPMLSLVVSEERSFYWRLTARENLEFFSTLYGFSQSVSQQRISSVAQMFNIDYLNTRYQELSTGMKNRLALARGFLHEARVIFMDEPTRSLDPVASRELRKLINDKIITDSAKTLFFSTHNIQEAEELADHFLILDQGHLVASGTLSDLREKINNPIASLETIFNMLIAPEIPTEVSV